MANAQRTGEAAATRLRTLSVEACPACDGTGVPLHEGLEDRAYGVLGRWCILRCSSCASGWLNPAPVPEDLPRCYVGAYYTHDVADPYTLGSSGVVTSLRRAVLCAQKGYHHLRPSGGAMLAARLLGLLPAVRRRAFYNLDEMLVPFRPNDRLLEVGCGSGTFLGLMQMLGWTVTGLEPDPSAAEVARKIAACHVHVGTIEQAPFPAQSFDAIVSSHVIEHVYDPRTFVAIAGKWLTPGGTIVVRTPNLASLGYKLFGPGLFSLDPPRHLCLFTPASLKALFERSGLFRKVPVSTPTANSRLAVSRRRAVRQGGNFLAEVSSSSGARLGDPLFAAVVAAGNPVFQWGEEIVCHAERA